MRKECQSTAPRTWAFLELEPMISHRRWTRSRSRSNRHVVRNRSACDCDGCAPGTAGHHHPGGWRITPGDAARGLGRRGGGHPAPETVQLLYVLHRVLRRGVRGRCTQRQREQKRGHHHSGAPGGQRRGEETIETRASPPGPPVNHVTVIMSQSQRVKASTACCPLV